jgi:hypothetical protein
MSVFHIDVTAEEPKLALIVGNSGYKNTQQLTNPVNDADAMSGVLKGLGFDVLLYKDLNLIQFKMAVDDFGHKLDNYDVGLFYYAGHGIQMNGMNYLIPIDANLVSEVEVEYDCIEADRIIAKMEASKTTTNIVILDACRNNPFQKSMSRRLARNGLAYMEAPPGTLIAYSTAPGQTASDGSSKNGLYTEALVNKISDPRLNALQVFQEVRKIVRESSNGQQIPWESTSLESDFFFNQSFDEIAFSKADIPKSADEGVVVNQRSIKDNIDELKQREEYLWSEAKAKSIVEADRLARDEINSRMAEFFSGISRDQVNPLPVEEQLSNKLKYKPYLDEMSNIVARRVYQKGKNYSVFRFIPRREIENMLTLKLNRAEALYSSGIEAETKRNYEEALKYLYWSYLFLSEHPAGEKASISLSDSEAAVIDKNDIAMRLKSIMSNTQAHITDSTLNNATYRYRIEFVSGGEMVEKVGFRYWNGVSWSEINSSGNGSSFVDVYPGFTSSDIKIKLEYQSIESSVYDPFLNKTLSAFASNQFDRESLIAVKRVTDSGNSVSPPEFGDYHLIVRGFLKSVKSGASATSNDLFTAEGFDVFRNLVLYGNASSYFPDTIFQTFSTDDFTYLRGIPLKFRFPNSKKDIFENICLELTHEGKINNITFALEEPAVRDILAQERWPDNNKWQIIRFLENYKTAYALKRFDYIGNIFSDRALIIVGRKVEESIEPEDNLYALRGERYEFFQLSKEQYLYRLRKVFDNNEFINIRFEDNIVRKRDNETSVYGINIKQNYSSSTYADQGYLFLMVDLKDSNRPVIYVRAWQPEKFSDGRVIDLSDFSF